MDFEELVRIQRQLGNQIETLARNYAKDPKDRKTPAYFGKRLETLTELAEEFHKNHEEIIAMKDKPLEDDDLVADYYNKITQIIIKHTKLFEQGSMQLFNLGDEAHASRENKSPLLKQPQTSAEIRKILRNQRALMKALIRNVDEVFSERHQEHHSSYYNIKASIIEKYMVDLANNNAALWASTEDDQIEDYNIQTFYELEERAEAAMIELQQHMHLDPPIPTQRTTAPGDIDVVLPKITLPIFDGNYQRWMEFKDIFSELVHNTTISETKKMHYLTTSLQGEPKNLIKHLPATGINYAAAWSLISSRYDNKRLLVSTLLNKLLSQPSIKRESAPSLKSLHDVTKECIQGLKAQEIQVQHWDVILVHILLHKMDEETQTAFEQSLTDNRRLIGIDELLRFLERRFQSLETRGKGDRATTRTCTAVAAGKVEPSDRKNVVCGICTTKELEAAVSQFWEAEEAPDKQTKLTEEELRCESHFVQTTLRAEDGRFIVRLPLNNHPTMLAESKGIAYKRFSSIERRLKGNPTLKDQYVSFMREYELLGHMTKIDFDKISPPYYFIPHHCVLRPESSSTKLRVVFDASAHNSSGASLNDIMYNGPTVQSELFSILLRFRMHKYTFKTDIEKMYRQIWVHQEDRNLQLILWRENEDQPINVYQLNTVTYGTRAAPYLATRCLVRLADEYQTQYPYGASSLRKDFYVDDGLIGADSIPAALLIQQQLITILGESGMKLKKWCSNHRALLSEIAAEDQEVNLNFDSKEMQSTKTLGLLWLPKSDVFCIRVNSQEHKYVTKRTMSSDLAHIYDPLGLLGPVLVTGKIQLQKTWQSKLEWDDQLPTEIAKEWSSYKEDLVSLDNITFPRYIFCNRDANIEIHAFSDASERAYGAAVYIRIVKKDKTVMVNLLCSKSRVAPTKLQTIPRLELCAALLAAELMARVKADLGVENKKSFCWTDSQIVLSWLQNQTGRLPAYVAHRVLKILHVTIPQQWQHVPSKQNPADILSRGIKPRELSSCTMWLYGPLFLYQPKTLWPNPTKLESTSDKNYTATVLSTQGAAEENALVYTIPSKNSFLHVQRVIGYILRFVRNCGRPKKSRPEHTQLSPLELDAALKIIVRQIQASDFNDIKTALIRDKFVPKTNSYSSLTPFLDEEGIIRVGGRLSASTQQFDTTHQMMLPSNDPIVKLLVEKIHKEHYHCGPQALLAQIRQRFWPIKGKSLARAVVQRCVRCTRAKPNMYTQIMGDLPKHRVQPARPFLHSGVDYCGPFFVHFKTRGKRPQKAYLAVFCCFATKAVHLELVTELTTEAFIGALKRFVARRGHCETLYCDNATNFVGARNKLNELNDVVYAKPAQESIIEACSTKGINFQFIPPRSPHFGGLWEAAVKSAKHMLIKNVSTASLTYEELETMTTEIEAILNSRPLIPSSSDANDLNAITPGHFLIGEPLTSSVDVQSEIPKYGLRIRWQLVSQLKHNFWERWSKEYLNELQQRRKWKGPISDIQQGTMVIIKEDNVPVLQWPLGRINKVYKGDDGLVRVCDVMTKRGIFKRPIHKLAPLFHETSEEQKIQLDETSNSASLPPTSRSKASRSFTAEETPTKRSRLNSTCSPTPC